MNESSIQPNQNRGISRRALTKGMAWSVPVIAATAAAPMIAASTPQRFRAEVMPPTTGTASGASSFTMPDDAENITFIVRGAGGGGAGGTGRGDGPGSRAIHYPGGAGHDIRGTLIDGVRGQQLQLVAGRGGGVAGPEATTSVGGTGFGAGGASVGIHGVEGATVLFRVRGGGGGGASALQVSGGTQVIAGAGGGGGGYAWALTSGITASDPAPAAGGDAETDGGYPRHTFTGAVDGIATSLDMNAAGSGGGKGALGATAGGPPDTINFDATRPRYSGGGTWRWPTDGQQMTGARGGAASLDGAKGGDGRGNAANFTRVAGGPLTRVLAQSGGGGGGYAGGGAGSARLVRYGEATATAVAWASFAAAGGGGGSSYSAGSLIQPGSVQIAHAGNGGAIDQPGMGGMVVVEFSSASFDPSIHDPSGIVTEIPST